MTSDEADVVVVGAGIVGLAVTRELQARFPGVSVRILERESRVAAHQTGHNSGVIHGGIYYQPGSLKARMCVEGSRLMYDFLDEHDIAYERCGKLIVALDTSELSRLDELHRRGIANEVPGLRYLRGPEVQEVEPNATGVAALHAPNTGIVDYRLVAQALAADVTSAGARIDLKTEVSSIRQAGSWCHTAHANGVVRSRRVITCAGLFSDRLAEASGQSRDPQIVPFRGAYLRLKRREPRIIRSMVYPVPDPDLPFLGVHVTPQMDGQVVLGPTAIWVPSRVAYDRMSIRLGDTWDALSWPGTWKVARRFWRTGLDELATAVSTTRFVESAARYVPSLSEADLDGSRWSGIRAQAVSRDGRLVDDFVVELSGRVAHVRNAPSPAATSSLALAKEIVSKTMTDGGPLR